MLLLLVACGDEKATTNLPQPTSGPVVSPTPLVNQRIGYATGPVARVGGEEISTNDFNQALDQTRVTTEEQAGGFIDWKTEANKTQLKDLQQQVLQGLINYNLIAQQARKEGVTVSAEEVATQFEDFKKQVGGDAGYRSWLNKRFLNDADNRRIIQQGLVFSKMEERHATAEDKAEQVKARHILLATEGEAKDMFRKLQQGGNFAALAQQFSLDATSAKKGGELDWVFVGQTEQPFEKALFTLKPGDISGPIKTSLGWHIIQVEAREVRPLPFDLVEQRKAAAFSDYIKTLRDKTTIEILLK